MATSFTIGLATSRDRPKTYLRGRGTRFGVQVFGTVMPDPDHWIRLADGPVDALGQRPLRIRMGYDDRARATMIDARDRLREVFADGGCTIRPDVHGDPELRPGMSVHYGGTVRMHERPEYGMLDGQNLLHAVPNVAVVDSAAFTTGPEKNPTLTAMAMAARAAAALDVG